MNDARLFFAKQQIETCWQEIYRLRAELKAARAEITRGEAERDELARTAAREVDAIKVALESERKRACRAEARADVLEERAATRAASMPLN